MLKPCPVCKTPFEESKLPEHLSRDHMDAIDPEVKKMQQHHGDKCVICGQVLPSAEALRDHNGRVHHL
jgi:hypothetical protein